MGEAMGIRTKRKNAGNSNRSNALASTGEAETVSGGSGDTYRCTDSGREDILSLFATRADAR
jgi:hypothetical protein